MGLQINTNVAAMNAYRNLSGTQGAMSTSLERLSSGLRINRAADDAAGLAISEKLRGQISGLKQASANAQDGISLIQTGEGALNESHSILQRMRQLSVQAANDTNTDSDRAQIQKEVDQLSQELSRIGNTTQFNGKNLLDGSFTGSTLQIGANANQNLTVSVGDMRGYALGTTGKVTSSAFGVASTAATYVAGGSSSPVANGTYSAVANGTGVDLKDTTGNVVASSADGLTFTAAGGSDTYTFAPGDKVGAGDAVTFTGTSATVSHPTTVVNSGLQAGTYSIDSSGNVTDASKNKVGTYDAATGKISDASNNVLATATNGPAAGTAWSMEVHGVDVSTQAAANTAITTVDNGISKVSDQRSTLGAVQNRLQHTINNLGVAAENLTASESRIRDTDMASEMTSFTRAQILSQAGISMLAQANQAPQSVLKLLG